MIHRTAAITAAILASSGVALAAPALSLAGEDNGDQTDTTTAPAPPPPAPAPAPAPQVAPAPPAPAPPAPKPKKKKKHHHHSSSKSKSGGGSNSGSGNGSSGSSSPSSSTLGRTFSQRQTVHPITTSASDTGTIPTGGVQAGGGGTASIAHSAGSSEGVLGAVAGLVVVATGTGLALRRRSLTD